MSGVSMNRGAGLGAWLRTSPRRLESWIMDDLRSTTAVTLVRIIVGVGIFVLVTVSWSNRRYFWGDASGWQDAQRETGLWGFFPFNFFNSADPDGLLQLKLAVVAIVGLFVAIGFATRLSILVAFFTVASLGALGPYAGDSGDNLIRLLLFFLIFTDSGARWSVDALIRRRFTMPRLLPDWLRFSLHNIGVLAIGGQTLIIYAIAGLTKLRGETWVDGSALYYSLHMEQFMPWPALNIWFSGIIIFVSLISWATVAGQLAFPLLLLNHYTRVGAVLLMMSFHLGIAVFMGLGVFSMIMFAADLIFIRDNEFLRVRDDVSRAWGKIRGTRGGAGAAGGPGAAEGSGAADGPSVADGSGPADGSASRRGSGAHAELR